MYLDYNRMTLNDFLEAVGSESPTPGGGAVCGVVGALAAGLSIMCASYTVGREKFADVQDEVEAAREKAKCLRDKCLSLAVEDAAVYTRVSEARKLPKETTEQENARRQEIDVALRQATDVPFEIAESAQEVASIAARIAEIGNPSLRADALTAVELAKAVVRGCTEQIKENLRHIHDQTFLRSAQKRLAGLGE